MLNWPGIASRRTLLGAACGLLVSAALSGAASAQQPNIIFIVVDDAGYADFGFQGSTEIPTPNLDALAARGVTFSDAHTGPACSPSRAAFLTGTHFNRFGYEANLQNTDDPLTEHFEGLPNSAVTMFERLQGLGYSTSVAGKWHVGGLDNVVENGVITTPGNRPPNQGVDHFIGFQAGGGLQEMFLNPDGTNNTSSFNSGGRHWSNLWGDITVDKIEEHYQDANPFFIYSSFNDPHSPITEAPSFNDPRIAHLSGQRKRYASEILTVDDNVGKIVERLEDPNGDGNQADSILDETMIVFLNDNGGVPGNSADNGALRGSKGSPYDGGSRVPMFISGAGVDPSVWGTSYGNMVHSVDIVPSMVAAAGGSIAAGEIDGVSLLPFVNGQSGGNPHEFFAQRIQEEVAYRTNDWKLVKDGYAGDWELYDISDPNNQSEDPSDDVAGSNPAQLEIMLRKLTEWEVTIDKQRFPSTDETIDEFNLFDDFVFRPGTAAFSAANGWSDLNNASATMRDRDSHNGTVFHFNVDDTAGFTAQNDLRRMNELDFVAHGFVLGGTLEGQDDQTGVVAGLPVLLAKNLDGESPFLELSESKSGRVTNPVPADPQSFAGGPSFGFELGLEMQLFDDLEIKGDGVEDYHVAGDIREWCAGRTITKTGSSTVRFSGLVEATGGGYLAEEGSTVLAPSATLSADLAVADGAHVQADGVIQGGVTNAGVFEVVDGSLGGVVSTTASLLPALGDGDVDSRNSNTKGDQDAQLLVGLVGNASGSTIERVQRALFSFDLSSIPDGATITDVGFTLQFDGSDGSSSNNIAGDLSLYTLLEDPAFQETGAENVDWLQLDESGGVSWATPGGALGALVGLVPNASLPDPRSTVQGDALALDALPALLNAIVANLGDDAVSFALALPGEEAAGAAMTGDRDLYRFGSNESSGSSAAVLRIDYEVAADTVAHVSGDFTQQATGVIAVGVRSAADYDRLVVGGQLELLGGGLAIDHAGLALGDRVTVIDSAGVVGEFDPSMITGTAVAPGLSVAVLYEDAGDDGNADKDRVDLLVTHTGDANGDGVVDLLDFDALASSFGGPGAWQRGDFNYDGVVDLLDFDLLAQNFGASAAGTVPEPGSLVLLAAAPWALWGRGRAGRRGRSRLD